MTTKEVVEFSVGKEYEKNPEISPEDIRSLREWLNRQPHLPSEHLSDLDLVLVYFCCNLSSEVSKQVLDLHYTLRTAFTSFFLNRELDQKAIHCFNTILYAPLPTPTTDGDRAIYCRLLDNDPKNFNFDLVVRCFMMVFDLWQREEGTWPGFVLMIDMDQTMLAHIGRLDIKSISQVLYFLQEAMLVKLHGLHFLSAPSFMDKLVMLLKPFMKKSLMDTMKIHQIGSDTIYKIVPKAAFPKDCGGEYKGFNTIRDETLLRMKNNQTFLKEENKRRVNEAVRPGGKSTVADAMLGVQGSFKKLELD